MEQQPQNMITSDVTLMIFHNELEWLERIITTRLSLAFDEEPVFPEISHIPVPEFSDPAYPYAKVVIENNLSIEERFILFLALTPYIYPDFLDAIIQKHLKSSGNFPQLGGTKGKNFRGFIPTAETAIFLLGGTEIAHRFHAINLISPESPLLVKQLIAIGRVEEGEPKTSGKLIPDPEIVELITLGKVSRPQMTTDFPAQYITTEMEWQDLILNDRTLDQIRELETWVQHNDTFLYKWGMARKVKPGYRALFYGPPGTGKTLTASLLGKYTSRDVFKIDLSMVVSKYIGETEKNLSTLFNKAENKNWILFFDEADAIFSKRTNVRDAHDKYANQEVAYLLQRIENYAGLVILASNFKTNIDDAFMRRFQSVIYFPMPKKEERLLLWQNAFPTQISFGDDIDFKLIARNYELTGSNIINIVQFTCLQALSEGTDEICMNLLVQGIEKEYSKEGKML